MASKPEDPPLTNPWITSDGSPLRGFYWTRIDPKVQPNYWVENKETSMWDCGFPSNAVSIRSEEEAPSATLRLECAQE
ncbi:hypothetical protein PENFLA_c042G03019 [Penicillium flavigenum]|uniref:Uncharacterized protein n=1 Tax=Penicillium flavigenum TaxID=254877 RepID=A0A1V6SJJ1_9EURO|nr:hypothetical protein PENFLA_c042G03019 [Penicillium flavigenum]